MSDDPQIINGHHGTIDVTARILRRFLPGQLRSLLIGLVLLLFATGASLLQPWPLKLVLDSVIGNAPVPQVIHNVVHGLQPVFAKSPALLLLTVLCVSFLVIELFMGICNVLSAYVLTSVALRMVFRLRCALFDVLQRQSLAFHDAKTVGDSLYRVTWDSYCIQSIFSEGVVPAMTAGATLLGIAAIMLTRDWRLAIAAAAVTVPLTILIRRLDKPMTEQSLRAHEYESDVSTRVQETLTAIRAVQAFGREDFENDRFRVSATRSLLAHLRLTVTQTASQAIVGLVLATATASVIWISARGVLAGQLTSGDLVLLVAYIAMVFKPLETLATTAGAVQQAAAGARRVLTLLEARPEIVNSPDARPLASRVRGEIVFDNVRFHYRNDQPVLTGISLKIPAMSSIALVGPSGAGKTTLASLILRFYAPTKGRVLIDGVDLPNVTLKSLRENIALVTQEPILFAASVRENIAYGRPGATREHIYEAARAARAHEFIEQLPEKYETQMAERGATLSSGQRQRIAIARAFLKDAPILVLDEPTSALDAEAEDRLLQTLQKLMKGRTSLIIAHRLSTVRCADQIVVLKAGRIAEIGTHEELLRRGEVYAHLHNLQFGQPNRTFEKAVAI